MPLIKINLSIKDSLTQQLYILGAESYDRLAQGGRARQYKAK
jgi:hypothetical protein